MLRPSKHLAFPFLRLTQRSPWQKGLTSRGLDFMYIMKEEIFLNERFTMINNNPFTDKFFLQGHKALTQGTFIFGGILFLLAVLIFIYPTLIAYFISGVILLAGISVLTVAWKLWRFREHVSHLENGETHINGNKNYRTRVTYFRWVA